MPNVMTGYRFLKGSKQKAVELSEKLSNVSEWDAYRASLRDFIINPKTDKLPKPLKTVTWKS